MNLCERHRRILFNNVSRSPEELEKLILDKITSKLGKSRAEEVKAEIGDRCLICWIRGEKLLMEIVKENISYEPS